MPVVLQGESFGREPVHRSKHKAHGRVRNTPCVHIGLVNNMPDPALQSTERQFVSLLDSASNGIAVRVSFYSLPGIPRAESARRYISRFYSSTRSLSNAKLDGLIVTGTEPRASNLREEPYWGALASLVDWAQHHTSSTVWSCLAAHAAVLHLDGIDRYRLNSKRFGVFDCAIESEHSLTAGAPAQPRIPHSRWNDLPGQRLADCGYRILTRTADGSLDTFIRERNSLFVFFQGHPEYEANTLLLEYRRDIGRYLRGERDTYPALPHGYFDTHTAISLSALRERAIRNRREDLLEDFPVLTTLTNRWRPAAIALYRNWLSYLSEEQSRRAAETLRKTAAFASRTGKNFRVAATD